MKNHKVRQVCSMFMRLSYFDRYIGCTVTEGLGESTSTIERWWPIFQSPTFLGPSVTISSNTIPMNLTSSEPIFLFQGDIQENIGSKGNHTANFGMITVVVCILIWHLCSHTLRLLYNILVLRAYRFLAVSTEIVRPGHTSLQLRLALSIVSMVWLWIKRLTRSRMIIETRGYSIPNRAHCPRPVL